MSCAGIRVQGALARPRELEEVPVPIAGGLDIHRKQLTFDYPGTSTGEVKRGQIAPADRAHLRAWLARFAGRGDVTFALEGCTGWRYVAGELAAAGVPPHVAEPADTAFARGRERHAETGKTGSRHLRELLAEGRLPGCWIPPSHVLECRALLETCHDLRAEHTARVQLRGVLPSGRPGTRRAAHRASVSAPAPRPAPAASCPHRRRISEAHPRYIHQQPHHPGRQLRGQQLTEPSRRRQVRLA
jgi:hypothetical protein